MKREINLSPEQVKAILLEAKNHSLRDYLLLKTMTIGDFRVGEVVGSAARRWIKSAKTWTPAEPNLRGLQIQDLHDDGIWVEGKGWKKEKNPAPPKLVPLPVELVKELRVFTAHRKEGRIFEISESRVEQMTRFYAKRAGVIEDRKSTRLNSSHLVISYAVFCLKKKIQLTAGDSAFFGDRVAQLPSPFTNTLSTAISVVFR